MEACLVVDKLDRRPVNLLGLVLGLFHLEDVLVEVLLQLLVCEVDAELLKVVDLELLKAVDVEDSDKGLWRLHLPDALVHLHDVNAIVSGILLA